MTIEPVITSNATVGMYVFIRVEMPKYNGVGLYNLDLNSDWSLEETEFVDEKYIAVYRYANALTPAASTSALASSLTMVDMSNADYAGVSDINATMNGYACGTEGESLETAWKA